jgi:hypothetical protein
VKAAEENAKRDRLILLPLKSGKDGSDRDGLRSKAHKRISALRCEHLDVVRTDHLAWGTGAGTHTSTSCYDLRCLDMQTSDECIRCWREKLSDATQAQRQPPLDTAVAHDVCWDKHCGQPCISPYVGSVAALVRHLSYHLKQGLVRLGDVLAVGVEGGLDAMVFFPQWIFVVFSIRTLPISA